MKKLMLMSLASLMILATSTKAEAATRAPDARWQFVEDGGDDLCNPGGFDKYMPFSLNKDLSPEVDDAVVLTFVLNALLPFGGLWAPLVLLPDDHPSMSAGDVVISYLIPYLGGAFTTWCAVGFVPLCYNSPVAALNAWDRAYKCGGKKRGKKKSKKKSGGGGSPEGDSGYSY